MRGRHGGFFLLLCHDVGPVRIAFVLFIALALFDRLDRAPNLVACFVDQSGGVGVYPIGLILRKPGYSPFLALLACVPVVNLICLWIVALGAKSPDGLQLNTVDRAGSA